MKACVLRITMPDFEESPLDQEDDSDMQLIGKFLSFASRGDRIGLNQMLRDGTSPNVQDYDMRTALHLAASEGHAPIVELLLQYKADVNLTDRWERTPLTDARLYGHRDICRILEVNGGKDSTKDHPMIIRHEHETNEADIDHNELSCQQSLRIEQGVIGESERVKWRGTWVVKTVIKRIVTYPLKMVFFATDKILLRELRHPNILQFLGSINQVEQMILITEYLSKGNLDYILSKKSRLDLTTAVRFALDIARGMNYLHQHKPHPIVHNHLDPRNLLQDEGGHLKIGEYWVQMLSEQIQPNQESCRNDSSDVSSNLLEATMRDIRSFGFIFYQMLEGRHLTANISFDFLHLNSVDFEPKFLISQCPGRIKQLIESCLSKDPVIRPTFATVIQTLEEFSIFTRTVSCPVEYILCK